MNGPEANGPSRWFFVLGMVVIVVSAGMFGYTLFKGISHLTDNLTQVVVPGEKELALQANTGYTIFLEEQSVVDGRVYSTNRQSVAGLSCTVTAQPSGKKIPIRAVNASANYNVNGRSGHSVLQFATEQAGIYHLSCAYGEGREGSEAVLAVGSGVVEGIWGTVFRGLAWFFGGGGLGAAIVVITLLKRHDARRRTMGEAAGQRQALA